MTKLVAMYKTPEDSDAFDIHYNDIHMPLVKRWPGLKKVELARVTNAPIGGAQHYIMAEMYFDNEEAMQRALASPEGKAATNDVMDFAGKLVTMFQAEVVEKL
jgi:uncharacterized protein (TIGR02118 family)